MGRLDDRDREFCRWLRTLSLLLALVVAGLVPASAQDVSGYVGASLFISPWSPEKVSGSPSLSFDNTGRTDRWLPGGTVEAGIGLGRRLDLGVEIALAPRRTIDQSHFYFNPFQKEARYRDTALFATAKLRAERGRGAVAVVVGAGLVHQSTLERRAEGRLGSTGYTFGAFGPEVAVARWGPGVMAGIDFSTRLSSRISVGPQLRVFGTDRGDLARIPEFQSLGIPKVAYRVGVAVRAGL